MNDTETKSDYRHGGIESVTYVPKGAWLSSGYSYTNTQRYNISSQLRRYEVRSGEVVGPRDDWKPFMHYKHEWLTEGSDGFHHQTNTWEGFPNDGRSYHVGKHGDVFWGWYLGTGSVGVFNPDNGLADLYNLSAPGGRFIPSPANLAALQQASLKTMLPGIKAELSLINSFIELKDFKTLPRTLSRIMGLPKALYNARGPLRMVAKNVADSFLQWKFNIAPLLSDIAGINSALSRTRKRVERLLDRTEKTQRVHYSLAFSEFSSSVLSYGPYTLGPSIPYYPKINGRKVIRYVDYEPSLFHAEIEYNFTLSRFQTEYAQLLGLLDALGVNLNPSIIWNAIPWTFVVDWVVGVSRWLDQFKRRNMDPQINIRRYLWSIRRSRRINSVIHDVGGTKYYWASDINMPVVQQTAYGRFVEFPSSSSFITSGLNSNEFTLGVALAMSRGRRRTRVR